MAFFTNLIFFIVIFVLITNSAKKKNNDKIGEKQFNSFSNFAISQRNDQNFSQTTSANDDIEKKLLISKYLYESDSAIHHKHLSDFDNNPIREHHSFFRRK